MTAPVTTTTAALVTTTTTTTATTTASKAAKKFPSREDLILNFDAHRMTEDEVDLAIARLANSDPEPSDDDDERMEEDTTIKVTPFVTGVPPARADAANEAPGLADRAARPGAAPDDKPDDAMIVDDVFVSGDGDPAGAVAGSLAAGGRTAGDPDPRAQGKDARPGAVAGNAGGRIADPPTPLGPDALADAVSDSFAARGRIAGASGARGQVSLVSPAEGGAGGPRLPVESVSGVSGGRDDSGLDPSQTLLPPQNEVDEGSHRNTVAGNGGDDAVMETSANQTVLPQPQEGQTTPTAAETQLQAEREAAAAAAAAAEAAASEAAAAKAAAAAAAKERSRRKAKARRVAERQEVLDALHSVQSKAGRREVAPGQIIDPEELLRASRFMDAWVDHQASLTPESLALVLRRADDVVTAVRIRRAKRAKQEQAKTGGAVGSAAPAATGTASAETGVRVDPPPPPPQNQHPNDEGARGQKRMDRGSSGSTSKPPAKLPREEEPSTSSGSSNQQPDDDAVETGRLLSTEELEADPHPATYAAKVRADPKAPSKVLKVCLKGDAPGHLAGTFGRPSSRR